MLSTPCGRASLEGYHLWFVDAAFFDLDKTIIARSSGLAFGRDFYREGFISKRVLARGIAAQFVYLLVGADENKMEQMREKALALTKGWDSAKIREIIEEVMGEVITPIIFREAVELIRNHQIEGRKVYIVSSSPEEIVAPLARLLEVDGHIASRPGLDEEGHYTGELAFYCYGPNKAEAMTELADKDGIDLAGSYAYSDSATDVPMLEAVGHPVAVNADRALRKVAAEREWETLTFTNPVSIRKKIAELAPSPQARIISGGVAVSVAAAALGYIWLKRRAEVGGKLMGLDRILKR